MAARRVSLAESEQGARGQKINFRVITTKGIVLKKINNEGFRLKVLLAEKKAPRVICFSSYKTQDEGTYSFRDFLF